MNNCQNIENSLIAYLDSTAAPEQRRQVEEHLAGCAACNNRVAEFRALWGALDELPAMEPSASFDAALRARLTAEPARHAWWRMIVPAPRVAFATAALIALSVWMVTVRQQAPPSAVTVAQVQPASEGDFGAIMQLQTLENYDVLANFDALSELPVERPAGRRK